MSSMNGKVVLVTGAARRVGAEIAQVLHAAGMNIVLHHNHSQLEAQHLAKHLNHKRKNSAALVAGELSDATTLPGIIAEAAKKWGRLDVLVNNASRFYRTDMAQVDLKAWDDLMNTNARAPFLLAQLAAPHLAPHNGCIVNITDIHAESPFRDYGVYCISKSALLMATKVLARELGPAVRVNAVAPGAVDWPEGENVLSEAQKAKIIGQTALDHVGNAHDIAKTVLFLIRDADYVTGQTINVDGGRSI